MLEASFHLAPNLIQNGYVQKPIAGRRGDNVKLIGKNNATLGVTKGKFGKQENIYQQLWCLPQVEEQYLQVCTFTVGGHYGSTCLRSDSSRVIVGNSDMQPLRVLKDK
ncbi:bifunctional glutathionylspermidine amidase/glutathionylspermidine synthetase [Haemophilus influenzae]|nr:bifunctional glutathionylspermidine amidase/glutathionylspermidine synthetase [Haemophilus influenzae]CWX77525.1 bifunctional glutathionylspermidine amidase/glutathionylspermidine synthetase [Haemophilus influenzae]SQG87905.1 bifunctional glutathionylspermidine amidase/glutathionylspermidine synthetase [Haemophilus influenzae]